MKKLIVAFLAFSLVGSAFAADGKKLYGEALTGAARTEIGSILANPESYEGRVVQVVGKVKEVCKNMGCWMEIQDEAGAVIQVKVDDGVIVFPVDAVGHRAVAEGKVEIRDMTREQFVEWRQHVAEEQGRTFDPAEIGEGPFRLIRLRGLGAEVEG